MADRSSQGAGSMVSNSILSGKSDFMVGDVGKAMYRLVRKIGHGSFGDIFLGINVANGEEVAVKLEPVKAKHPQLLYESKLYQILSQVGICETVKFLNFKLLKLNNDHI